MFTCILPMKSRLQSSLRQLKFAGLGRNRWRGGTNGNWSIATIPIFIYHCVHLNPKNEFLQRQNEAKLRAIAEQNGNKILVLGR